MVSVCIIAKNEETYIGECLKRLKPYGFEIIVTDTGSTDRTVEIARQYADKVLHFEWIDDFSAARNYCAAQATNDWILALDCDEYMERADMGQLAAAITDHPQQTGVIRLKNLTIREDGTQGYDMDDVVRLYDRRLYTFCYPIHEQLCRTDGVATGVMEAFLMPVEVVHHGYVCSKGELYAKQKRNLALLEKQVQENPEDAYALFQMGNSYYVLQEYEKAGEYFERGLALNADGKLPYVQIMIESLSRIYVRLGRPVEALELLRAHEAECPNARYVYNYANVCVDNDQLARALLLYLKAVSMKDADTLGDNLQRCYRQIIAIYHAAGDEKMAQSFRERYEQMI